MMEVMRGPCRRSHCFIKRTDAPAAIGRAPALRLQRKLVVDAQASSTNSATTTPATTTPASVADIKQSLMKALEGIDRGIFGVQVARKHEIHNLITALEQQNPVPQPTQHLDQVAGSWKLLYTTISITGSKKTKLGLREFVKLGAFTQRIDVENSIATNEVEFSVMGLGKLQGALTISASFQPVSPTRVDITFKEASLVPVQLQKLFEANYDLLLSVFNPQGWLEISYLDQHLRAGRDDKGNIFLLERCQ